ncbi:MAG: class C sortase [Coprococcus sp.]
MKKIKGRIISDIFLLIAVIMLLYPVISDIWNEYHSSHMMSSYNQTIEEMTKEDYSNIYNDAVAYNRSLIGNSSRFILDDDETVYYNNLLNINGDGIIGYLTVEKIGAVNVPIYHGISSEVLQVGAGHYPGSSLPIGGESTHSVISGHTGMSGMKMFTELDKMEIGDTFQITIMGEVLTYQVDRIKTVLPDNLDYLAIEEGRDYCTLVTCTPIGINSHRLLVRGVRIPTPEKADGVLAWDDKEKNIFKSIWKYIRNRFATYEIIMTAVAMIILLFFVIPDLIFYIKFVKRRRLKSDESGKLDNK